MEKLTKRDYFNRILSYAHEEDKPFLLHEMELLEKKNASRSTKPTAKQVANTELMDIIYNHMQEGVQYTVTELQKQIPDLGEFTLNKVNALVRGLKLDGRIIRSEVKGKAYFTKI